MNLGGVDIQAGDVLSIPGMGQFAAYSVLSGSLWASEQVAPGTTYGKCVSVNSLGIVTQVFDMATSSFSTPSSPAPSVSMVMPANLPGTAFVVNVPSIEHVEISFTVDGTSQAKCECGGKAVGIADYMAGHYTFCDVHESKRTSYDVA